MGNNRNSKDLLPREVQALLSNLKIRFEKSLNRHSGIFWEDSTSKLYSLDEEIYYQKNVVT